MQKTIIAVVVLALVGAGLYYILTMYQPNPDTLSEFNQEEVQTPGDTHTEEGEGEVRGTIVSVNTEQAMVDGPILILVQEESGEEAVVAVPSMGLPMCAARANMADAFALTAGQYIEAHGSVGVDGMIIPCESADHYLRVVVPN
jgi:hypothetical protein